MKGWKTWLGTSLIAIGTVLETLPILFEGQSAVGKLLLGLGAALTGVGIAHKLEKSKG